MSRKKQLFSSFLLASALLVSVGSFVPARADGGQAPQSVKDGISQAVATVQELDGLAIACLAVALTPLGAMLTLRFLNMVLSRV